MSDREAGEAISSLIKELEAATLKDTERIMNALKHASPGRWIFQSQAMEKKLLAG